MTQHPTCGYNNLALLEFRACTGEPSLRYFMNPSMSVSQLAQCSVLLTLADALQVRSYPEQLTCVCSLTREAAKQYAAENFTTAFLLTYSIFTVSS